ncbi:MAG: NAD(P)/FAD-dependent oxidoreductase [Clostridia bacterium]
MADKIYDVIIVGAGPAGSIAAKVAAEEGLEVLLIDKHEFPRDKVCGGYLSKKTLDLLKNPLDESVIEQGIFSIRLYDEQYRLHEQSFPQLVGVTVRRSEFDHYLLKQALERGIDFKSPCKVINVGDINNKEKVKVYSDTQVFYGKKVIAADGVNSIMTRKCHALKRWTRWQTGFTVSTILNTGGPPAASCKNMASFFCIPFLGGFGWAFPLKQGYNVGVGCWSHYSKVLVEFFDTFLKCFFELNSLSQTIIHPAGRYIPAGGFTRAAACGNILFAGDCAGFVDPFSGEGIYYAIRSGEIAAQEVAKSLNKDDHSAAESYTQRCRKEFNKDFKYSLFYSVINGRKKSIATDSVKAQRMLESMAYYMYNPYVYRDILSNHIFHHPLPTTHYPLR